MRIKLNHLRTIIREEIQRVQGLNEMLGSSMRTEDPATLADKAAEAVEHNMNVRPVKTSDGIWRFDNIIERIVGKGHDKAFWLALKDAARSKATDHWSPYMIVASYAETKAAFATPGFVKARHNFT